MWCVRDRISGLRRNVWRLGRVVLVLNGDVCMSLVVSVRLSTALIV